MARRRFPSTTFDQINVTPLIDTLFFLLIIFMLTVPILEHSIDVSLPKANTTPIEPDKNSKVVNIRKNGEIIFEDKSMRMEDLVLRLREVSSSISGHGAKFYIRGDKDLRYGAVIDVLKSIKNAGFENVFLVTEEEK